jgi:hypothetical protein
MEDQEHGWKNTDIKEHGHSGARTFRSMGGASNENIRSTDGRTRTLRSTGIQEHGHSGAWVELATRT